MGHAEIIEYLIGFCRQAHSGSMPVNLPRRKMIDINTTDTDNKTPLQIAAEKGKTYIGL